tara:strand:- start:1004 stop:1477 length:474 start_codon:yes stop_codon:yes gene_type:complete
MTTDNETVTTENNEQVEDDDLIIDQIIRIVVLTSQVQIICGLQIMETGEDDNKKTIGYYLHTPCVLTTSRADDGSVDASMSPWIPGSKDRVVPISLNQVTTIVEPLENLADMYVQNILVPTIQARENGAGDVSKHHALNNEGVDSVVPIYQPNHIKE